MRWLFACACVFVFLTAISVAQTTAPTTKPAQPPAPAPVSNTKCPVSNDAVDAKAKTAVYQGKTIGFCCDDCVDPFNKNPEKYAKNIK
jgi:YHS domain-containing protein